MTETMSVPAVVLMIRNRAQKVLANPEDALSFEVFVGLLQDFAEGTITLRDVRREFTGYDRLRLSFPMMADPGLKPLLDHFLDAVAEEAARTGNYVETNWGTFTMDELTEARADIGRGPDGRAYVRFHEATPRPREVQPSRYVAPW